VSRLVVSEGFLVGLAQLLLQLLKSVSGSPGLLRQDSHRRLLCPAEIANGGNQAVFEVIGVLHEGDGLGLAPVLNCQPKVALLDLQLRLPDDVELDRLDAERLGLLLRRLVLRGITLDDANPVVTRRAYVAEEVIDIPLHQRDFGRKLVRGEHLDGDQVVQAGQDIASAGR
jgi:hypothetical protein